MKRSNVLFLGAALVALGVAACDSTGPGKAMDIMLTARTQSMIVGDTAKVTPYVVDGDKKPITNPTLEWSSNDPDVATVDGNGLIKAVGAGTAIISATEDGTKGTIGVIVVAPTTAAK